MCPKNYSSQTINIPTKLDKPTFFILDLGLHILNRVRRLNFKSDSLPSECLNENLHATSQTEDKMQSRLFLNVIIGKRTAVFELLASKNETLLIGRNACKTSSARLVYFVAAYELIKLSGKIRRIQWYNQIS